MDETKSINQKEKFFVNDRVMYKNILGEWHEGIILRVNNTTIRILNEEEFKILSIKRENVFTIEDYNTLIENEKNA